MCARKSKTLNNKYCLERFLISLLLCIVGVLGVGGCRSDNNDQAIQVPTLAPEFTDLSWTVTQSCPYPCWYGLEVGKSTKADFLELVDALSFLREVEEISINDYSEHYSDGKHHEYIFVPCEVDPMKTCVIANFTDGTLVRIQTFLNYDLTIAEVGAEIGPPDYWCPSSPHPEMKASEVYWVWIDRGFVMHHEDKDDQYYKEIRKALRSDLIMPGYLPIDEIFYRLPEELEWNESRCQWTWVGLKE